MSDPWGTDALDLPAYLARVAPGTLPGAAGASLLNLLHVAHATALPYDNIDLLLDRAPSLYVPDIVDKMCRRPRGGCCHEHNLLFGCVLERLGFHVERLAARVVLGGRGPRPRTHMALRVVADGDAWLCDVGFGEEGFLAPLPLREGEVTGQGSRAFRVRAHRGHQCRVEVNRNGAWECLYLLSLEARPPVDFAVANHYVSTHPRSMLKRELYLQRLSGATRLKLRGHTLTRVTGDHAEESSVGSDALPEVLNAFGIGLREEELAALRRRVTADI
ncbi:arylamine N-acetyltransferase family protein [Streptosporangium saharense]|uniref:arylamine N-acetyltransferase family protein n=1 Tax=Streptosporangium saharense TaxID=1706840 RepID=UPI0034407E3C